MFAIKTSPVSDEIFNHVQPAVQLNDKDDPPPGGLQTRVDDRSGTSSSSCFPGARNTNYYNKDTWFEPMCHSYLKGARSRPIPVPLAREWNVHNASAK